MLKRTLIAAAAALAVAAFTTAMTEPAAAGCTITSNGTYWCYKLVDRTSPSFHAPRPTGRPQGLTAPRAPNSPYVLKRQFVTSYSTSAIGAPRPQWQLRRR